jgi:hypothetical protein
MFKQGGVALLRHNRVKKIVLVLVYFGAFSSLGLLVVDYVIILISNTIKLISNILELRT